MIHLKIRLSACFFVATLLCGAGHAQTAPLALDDQSKTAMDLAIELYPSLFQNGSEVRTTSGYLYRYFSATGIYVGFKDGQIYLLGGIFGNQIVSKGSVTSVVAALQDAKAKVPRVSGAGLALSPAFKGLSSFANKAPTTNGGGTFVYSQGVGIPSVTVTYTRNVSSGVEQVQVNLVPDFSGVDAYISKGNFSVPACILAAVNGFSAPVCSSVGVTFNKATGDIYFDKTPMQQGFGGTTVAFTLSGSLTFPPF